MVVVVVVGEYCVYGRATKKVEVFFQGCDKVVLLLMWTSGKMLSNLVI